MLMLFYEIIIQQHKLFTMLLIYVENPGQTATVVNDRIRRNTMIYLCPYYDRIFPCRIRRNTVVYGEEDDRIRSLYTESACDVRFTSYFSIYDRFSSYTVTTLYDRNTGTGITTKYGRIRS